MAASRWADLLFQPDEALSAVIQEAWSWLLPQTWRPVLVTRMGGVFLLAPDGVHWLDCGTAEIERVADDEAALHRVIQSDAGDYWLMSGLIHRLHAAGKVASGERCYWFLVPPVFEGGVYEPSNMFVAPGHEVFSLSAEIHRQISENPDSKQFRIRIVD
jgi:hypothetical protein